MTSTHPLLLRVEAAAELLGVSRSTLYDLIARGEIGSVRIGRSRRVPLVAVDEFVERLGQTSPRRCA